MNRLWIDCSLEIKSLDDEGRIRGLGAVFGNVDMGGDRIEPGAFADTVRKNKSVPMLWQHFDDQPIGVWDYMAESRRGLEVQGQINLDTQQGREARSLAKQGAVKGLSIGYSAKDYAFEGDIRVLKTIDLWEVSLATFPMNPKARVAGVKNHTPKVLEAMLRQHFGLSRTASKQVASYIRNFEHEEADIDGESLAGMLRDARQQLEQLMEVR